jgi:hypothetical protein
MPILYLKFKCVFSFKAGIFKNWWFSFAEQPGLWKTFTEIIQHKSSAVVTQMSWHLEAWSLTMKVKIAPSQTHDTTTGPSGFNLVLTKQG